MRALGVIPARWASTRFEGKVLADISGKPMIQYVWERASQSAFLDEVMIACDDKRVQAAAEKFGAKAVMTSPDHRSGTDRIAEAVKDTPADVIINIQGDEPLLASEAVDALAQAMGDDPSCPMATLIKVCTDADEINNPNVVKAVADTNGYALLFSRSPIPCNRDKKDGVVFYKHIGLYAYRKDFLNVFTGLPKGKLEEVEQLEQLRVLEAGYKIKTVLTEQDTVGVDTPEDLDKVKEVLNV